MTDVKLTFGSTETAVDETRLLRFLAHLDRRWSDDLSANLEERSAFRHRLGERYQDGLDAMVMLHVCAVEAAAWADETIETALADDPEDDGFGDYYEVIRGLLARTMMAFDEVTWLLRGGYPNAAYTRVRTMQELFIIGSVLAEHANPGASHPELVERYVRHHEVFTRSVAEELMATEILDPPRYFDAQTLAALDAQRDELIARYGKTFKSMCGWAAPLFPDNTPVTMARLSGLVTARLNYFYGLSSSHVHGGSQGWHDNFIVRGDDVILACGATNLGLVVPAQLATAFLLDMLEIAVPAVVENAGKPNDSGTLLLAGIRHIADRAMKELDTGQDKVIEEEQAFQARRRAQPNM